MIRHFSIAAFGCLFTFGLLVAEVPRLVSYHGKLTEPNGQSVSNGDYEITFTIYDASIGGNSKWSETYSSVAVTDGLFSILLGSIIPITDSIFVDPDRYLGIKVGADPELVPRMMIVTVPYAMRVSTVDGASGGLIAGGLEIVVADLDESGNAFIIRETSGNIQATITAKESGIAQLDFYDPVDSKGGLKAIGDPKVSISKDGLTMFGITQADTTFLAFPNGNIVSQGQIAVGTNSSASAVGATVFGYNNTAGDSSAVVGGGSYNTAGGVHSTISGGTNNTASSAYSNIAGGTNNTASGIYSTISGGGYHVVMNYGSSIGGGLYDTVEGEYTTICGGKFNYAGGDNSVIGGGYYNRALDDRTTICGGYNNSASASNSSVGGGIYNLASGSNATVGGGQGNSATAFSATIGGGDNCIASGGSSTISGGATNTADGIFSSVGGGRYDSANGDYATVPGGSQNNAGGSFSFAAGRRAKANNTGSFVFGDSFDGDVTSSNDNEFTIRMSGGYRFYTNTSLTTGVTLAAGGGSWASVSDRTLKENITSVDGEEILNKISQLEISRWNYQTQDESIQHIGPMAQDFYELFQVGDNNTTITTIDPDGISLAAIKALIEKNEKLEDEVDELKELVKQLIESKK